MRISAGLAIRVYCFRFILESSRNIKKKKNNLKTHFVCVSNNIVNEVRYFQSHQKTPTNKKRINLL